MALTKDEIKEFKKKEKEAEGCTSFSIIANGLSYAGDKEWAKNVYKKAEEKADDFYDLRNLADSIFNDLGDEEWSRTLYMKAEEIVDNNFAGLADSIFEHLGDKEWARNLYKKAEEKADDFDDLRGLAESVFNNIDDVEWSRTLYKRADNQAESYLSSIISSDGLISLAYSITYDIPAQPPDLTATLTPIELDSMPDIISLIRFAALSLSLIIGFIISLAPV